MNDFYTEILSMKKDNYTGYIEKSYKTIYETLFLQNKWGNDKLTDIDSYDSETNRVKEVLPGSIYMFKYKSKSNITYNINNIYNFDYSDELPLVLIMKVNDKTILGINLNICNLGLRTLILNDLYNLDTDYFKHDAEYSAINGNFPISKKIVTWLSNENNLSLYYKLLTTKYKLDNLKYILRTYSKSNISHIRFIEPWLWKYIPFLLYKSIKDNIMLAILKSTNIDKINI